MEDSKEKNIISNTESLIPTKQKSNLSLKEKFLLLKHKVSNIAKKITNSKLSQDDPYTVQSRLTYSSEHKNFYIKDTTMQYLLGNPSYTLVKLLYKNESENIYVYLGAVGNAGNAIGMLQTDTPNEDSLYKLDKNLILDPEIISSIRNNTNFSPKTTNITPFRRPDDNENDEHEGK